MRILFNYYAGGGGGFSNILELLKSIANEHPDAKLILIDTGKLDFSAISGIANVETVIVDSTHGEWSRLAHGLWGLNRIADEVKADVVWSMNLGAYIGRGIPQVLSINNAYQVYPFSVLRYHPSGFLRALLLRFFSWLSMRASSGLVFQTPVMRDMGREQAVSGTRTIVAAKSVDYSVGQLVEAFAEKHLVKDPARNRRFVYLYVASLFPHKNHRVLLDALEILRNRGVEIALALTVEPSALVAEFGAKAERLIEIGFIIPVGWVGKDQLRGMYEACDACVMPSVLESLSSAHLEAMAWSRAQIVADMPYARDLCKDAALYVDPHNAIEWADAMERLSTDRDERVKLIEAGRVASASLPIDWKSIADVIFGFLKEIAKESTRKGG